jgi:glyoxylase-like metal-dependent hydrolase (beta-lactamase superfamily II)
MTSVAESGNSYRHLGDGVYQLATDYPEVCNAPLWTYLLTDGESFALIDPGVRSTFHSTLSQAIVAIGLDLSDAELLLVTHGHPDHSGGVSSWEAVAPHARIAAPLADTPWVESFDRQWDQFWDDYPGTLDNSSSREFLQGLCEPGPSVSVLLRDGDTVSVGSRVIDVIETRGHTWGHCAFYDRLSRTLFTGDAAQGRGTRSSDGHNHFAPLYLHVADARWGLKRMLEIPFERLCPAHGEPMEREQGLEFLADSIAFIGDVEEIAREMIHQGGDSPVLTSELAKRIGELCGAYPAITPQSAPTARAHLYDLAREGLISSAWVHAMGSS